MVQVSTERTREARGGSLGEARKFDDSGSPLGLALGPLFIEEWERFLSLNLESFFNGFLSGC